MSPSDAVDLESPLRWNPKPNYFISELKANIVMRSFFFSCNEQNPDILIHSDITNVAEVGEPQTEAWTVIALGGYCSCRQGATINHSFSIKADLVHKFTAFKNKRDHGDAMNFSKGEPKWVFLGAAKAFFQGEKVVKCYSTLRN